MRSISPFKAGIPLPHSHPHLLQAGELYPGILGSEFAARRSLLASQLPVGATAIIPGYGLRYATGGIFYPFHQHTDMLYLSGLNEQDAAMAIERFENSFQYTLFVKPADKHSEIWDGPRIGMQGAINHFGANEALPISQFPSFIAQTIKDSRTIFTDLVFQEDILRSLEETHISITGNHAASAPKSDLSITQILRDAMRIKASNLYPTKSLSSITQQLRCFKSPSEIKVLKKSGEISGLAFIEAMKASYGGISEHLLHATIEYEVKKRGAQNLAYVPVVAGGSRALVIHYVTNNQIIRDGELVLMDAGGEYAGYASDITRTWPVNGKFTPAQREIYEAVLKVNKQSIQKCTEAAKTSLDQIHHDSVELLRIECERIFQRRVDHSEMNILYPHHISHYMGMDVHDTPGVSRSIQLEEGMVVTIEPGLYIPQTARYGDYQGIGIRIEDDVIVGKEVPTILTGSAPKEVDEIESLIARSP